MYPRLRNSSRPGQSYRFQTDIIWCKSPFNSFRTLKPLKKLTYPKNSLVHLAATFTFVMKKLYICCSRKNVEFRKQTLLQDIFYICKYSAVQVHFLHCRCSALTRTGIGLLGKPPAVKQFPPSKANRRTRLLRDPRAKGRYEANKCGWTQPLFRGARDRGII